MTDLRAIARHYGGTVTGGQALIPAIGHSARDRGVAIKVEPSAPDGCLVHCFNGADPLAEKDRLRADGFLQERLSKNDNIPWHPPIAKAEAARDHAVPLRKGQRIVATFNFKTSGGAIAYRKHRIEPGDDGREKIFKFDRPDDNGGWQLGQGEDRVPYRLPDLVTANRDMPIYMAEGEAKADKLASWGLLATSHKDWKGFEFSAYVKGRTVYILPDNDATGVKQAADAKEAIELAEGTAHIIELPGLPSKGDILDWTGTSEDLRKLVDKATDAGQPFHTLDLIDLAGKRAHKKAFAIEHAAPAGEVTLYTGVGSAGKSLSGQQFATAAAGGISCLGLTVQPCATIYLTCEDPPEELHWRQEHICAALELPMDSLADRLHLISLRGELDNALSTFGQDGILRPTPTYHRLVKMIGTTGSKLVFLDNVAHLFTGNENDRGEVTQFVNLLNRLAGETGAAIVLIGHPNKSGDSYSGSTAWLNAVRSQITIDHERDSEGFIADPDARILTVGKANYTRKGEAVRFRWHDWAYVLDSDLPPDTRKELAEVSRANSENEAFLRCLAQRTSERRHVSEKVGANYAPKIFATMAEAKGLKKDRLVAAMDRLFRIGEIERGFLWRDTAEGKDIFGLRKTGNVTGNAPETRSANDRRPAGINRVIHPIDTTYQSGAASRPAAPADNAESPAQTAAQVQGKTGPVR
ncbi:AAA family ATPase [Croceicoccus sp. YJ47]|uniref:AAA family ATPase n=1 Tax=Croceicoccus sp. YJ47 TaxID=2798724 RepID=UPI00192041FD|nr:AAA family ATPase [Croceicoccus sp. YJ47]QQN73621.1 AAA family ATPase [Croceicoccus sp. YJ47]